MCSICYKRSCVSRASLSSSCHRPLDRMVGPIFDETWFQMRPFPLPLNILPEKLWLTIGCIHFRGRMGSIFKGKTPQNYWPPKKWCNDRVHWCNVRSFILLVFVFIVLDVSKPNELNSLLVGYSNIVSQPMKKLTIKI
jgi:hypothetical protein